MLDMSINPGIDGLGTYKETVKISQGLQDHNHKGFAENKRVREVQELGQINT